MVLTGDIHSSWACDVPADPGTLPPASPANDSVAVEFVTPSVTSDNLDEVLGVPQDSPPAVAVERAFTGLNRHVRFLEFQRHGYAVAEVTTSHVQMDWWFVSDRTDPDATQSFGAAYHVVDGANAVGPAPGPLGPRTSSPRRAPPGSPRRRPRLRLTQPGPSRHTPREKNACAVRCSSCSPP